MDLIIATISNVDYYVTFERIISFVFAVLIGSGVKLGYKAQSAKLNSGYVFFVISCAMLVGYWIDVYATSKGWIGARGALVSGGALVSESIISYFFTNDSSIIDDIKDILIKKLGGKKDDLDSDN